MTIRNSQKKFLKACPTNHTLQSFKKITDMARKQERKYKSFNLEDSPVVEEDERLLNNATTPQQTQTIVAPVAEATEQTEAAEPAEAVAPIVQLQQQVQPQVHPEPQPQPSQSMGMSTVGNRSKRTEQGSTVIVPMKYYEQIALMKMRTGITIRDIALQAVIEFVDNHKND